MQLGLGEEIELTGRVSRGQAPRRHPDGEGTAAARAQARAATGSRCSSRRPAARARTQPDLLAALGRLPARGNSRRSRPRRRRGSAGSAPSQARPNLPEIVAVCDVGGGSTQIVVGTSARGPEWAHSFDVGSLRLTHRAPRRATRHWSPPIAAAAGRGRTRARTRHPADPAGRARHRRHGTCAPPSRRPQPRPRGARDRDSHPRRRESDARSRRRTESTRRGRARCSPARSSSPRPSGGSASRSRSRAAGSGRAQR